MMNTCEQKPLTPNNHSKDIIKIYNGNPKPVILCGYHASQYLAKKGKN